jgi:hypothetical protein
MNFWLKGNITIPARPHTVGGLIGWARGVNRALTELRDRKIVGTVAKPTTKSIKPPLWVTLRRPDDDPDAYEVYAQFGHVVPRHNGSSETGTPIEITSLPTPDEPLTVIEDDKLWVELTIDAEGKCTAAEFDSGTAWPDDAPPELIGGDDQTGTPGQRYIRIAEIIVNPESTATTPPLISDQLHTGHIDHFQPELLENTTTSASAGSARVMKQWNASTGVWELRYLTDGSGITITENAEDIEIKMKDGVTDGDMLYWDATAEEWVLLAAPPSGYKWVLQHDGTTPEWVEYQEIIVNICVDGTPTEYTILGIPTP